jgi:hypothetical protein
MKVSLGDKAQRVLKMMLGMRNARIAASMAAYGFTNSDLQEGWDLLRGVSRAKLDVVPAKTNNADTLDKLDAWEHKWFPIAEATVERRFPAVHAQLFRNLSRTTGPEVAVSVRTFVDRFDAMAAGSDPYGVEGKKAAEVLAARGISKSVIDEARSLLETVTHTDSTQSSVSAEEDTAQLAEAEDKLWAWYLEWSQIARTAITQRALLRQMGFGGHHKTASEPDAGDGTDGTPAVAAPPATPALAH